MSSRIGHALSIQLFGESHGKSVGVTLDGLPAGLFLPMDEINAFIQRRASRGSALSTGRVESDQPILLSGVYRDFTTGQPLTAIFENADTHSADYDFLPDHPRPGHADYPATIKSAGFDDLRGSGHHSGRLTLPYAFAGAVAMQLLSTLGIKVRAHILSVGDITEASVNAMDPALTAQCLSADAYTPWFDEAVGARMSEAILSAKRAGDSLGGVVEVFATGAPVGLGAPYFDGFEAVAAQHFFSIPAVKGVEFGVGFEAAKLRGSEYNDPYTLQEGQIKTTRNSAGGLLGGLTNGMPILARVAFRPTPSIGLLQQTVSLSEFCEQSFQVHGRHDPCVALRAVPVVESALALTLCELWLERRGHAPLSVFQAPEQANRNCLPI
ncbi:MAG: chorismate synthase [Clostridia bacterium]